MPGRMIVSIDNVAIGVIRYETPAGRRCIVSLLNALYNVHKLEIILSPDRCTEAETAAQCEKVGCGEGLRRFNSIHRDGDHPYRPLVSKSLI